MKKLAVLAFILFSFLTTLSAIVVLDHNSTMPLSAAAQAKLELEVKQGFEEIQDTYIYFREIKADAYQQMRLVGASLANPIFIAQLPSLMPNVEGYEYYFEVVRVDGQIQTLPEISPLRNPYRIMQETSVLGESGFVVLSPMADEINSGEDLILAISTFALTDKLDSSSVKIVVNGVDVTSSANITDNLIVYRMPKPKPGNLNIQISGKAKDGTAISAPPMTYTVKHGAKLVNLPYNLRGNISFNTNVVSVSAENSSVASGSKMDDASTNFNLYGGQGMFKFSTKVFLSTLENKNRQPINRYTLGLNIPSVDVILGDNTPYFNSYTLNSTNIRGLYAKIYSKGFALIGMYGQSKRSIDGKESSNLPGTFSRDASALRMQFGSMNGFLWSFNVAKSRDIISSLPSKYYQITTSADTTQTAFPIDNLVLGTDMRLSLFKNSFILGLEGAGSLYNTNILPGPISVDEFEDYIGDKPPLNMAPDDFESIFIINKNMEPFIPSIANAALQGYIRTFFYKNYLSVSYSQVGASFHSLSANYLQSDTRTINISDNISIRNMVFLDGGLNIVSDNLSKQKSGTSTYNNWYIQSLFRMVNLPYLRIGYHTSEGKNKENPDLISSAFMPMNTENSMIDVGMGYDFVMMPVAPTKLDVTYNTGMDKDKLNSTYELNTSNVLLTLTSRFQQIPLLTRISFNTAAQDNQYESTTTRATKVKTSNTDFGLHGEYKLLYEKLIPFADFRTTVLGGDQSKQTLQFINIGARYMPFEQSTISTNLGFKTYANSDVDNIDYNSVSWNLNISQRF